MSIEMIFNPLTNFNSVKNQPIFSEEWTPFDIELVVKREDEIHPEVSGNKFRKLKYNINEAKKKNQNTLLTFGGAFSNHIAATAAAGKYCGFKTIGIIRGEELEEKIIQNPTLLYAKSCGMNLHFISREAYKQKQTPEFIAQLHALYGTFYLLPEGGTNTLAIKGCEEILNKEDTIFDYVCVSVGTGGTIAGIINSSQPHQKVIGFSVLKGTFLNDEVSKWTNKTNWEITDAYCFGGYAKINTVLITFINKFKKETGISLDPIYTGKMMFGIIAMIKEGKIPKKSRILAIHTGGLQGIIGMNEKLKIKNLPLIEI